MAQFANSIRSYLLEFLSFLISTAWDAIKYSSPPDNVYTINVDFVSYENSAINSLNSNQILIINSVSGAAVGNNSYNFGSFSGVSFFELFCLYLITHF